MNDRPAKKTRQLLKAMSDVAPEPLGLGKAGELAGRGAQFDFTFEYLGFLFAVKATSQEQRTNMRFHANLGYLPYTAEDPKRRLDAMRILFTAGKLLGGKVHLSREQRIMLTESLWFDEPLTPVVLVSRATQLLVQAKPVLELLSESVVPPGQRLAITRS